MPQVISGHLLGAGVFDFFGTGDPNSSSDSNVQRSAVGSTYRRLDGGSSTVFYVREALGLASGWVAK